MTLSILSLKIFLTSFFLFFQHLFLRYAVHNFKRFSVIPRFGQFRSFLLRLRYIHPYNVVKNLFSIVIIAPSNLLLPFSIILLPMCSNTFVVFVDFYMIAIFVILSIKCVKVWIFFVRFYVLF